MSDLTTGPALNRAVRSGDLAAIRASMTAADVATLVEVVDGWPNGAVPCCIEPLKGFQLERLAKAKLLSEGPADAMGARRYSATPKGRRVRGVLVTA